MTDKSGAMQVDAALVRQLAELLDETKLTEIEVQDGERKIRVARSVTVAAQALAPQAAALAPAAAEVSLPPVEAGHPVKSPMVGTVFLAAEPGAKPFAGLGDTVTEGQTVVIIEAMKVMNPIAAPRAGKVIKICVDNGQPVEFDQPLLVIE